MLKQKIVSIMVLAVSFLLLLSFLIPRAAVAQTKTGYIHLDPSGKGFVYEGRAKFLPRGINLGYGIWKRHYEDDPVTGREYIYPLGGTTGLTYDQYFQTLSQAGINSVRVWLVGGSGNWAAGFEPIPVGTYNIADEIITDSVGDSIYRSRQIDGKDVLQNYPNCRYPNFTQANCGSYAAKFQKSLITRMVQAAEKNGVKFRMTLFDHSADGTESYSWDKSSYNVANGGPLNSNSEFWTNAKAKELVKQRFEFVTKIWGDSPAIWSWEIWNEIPLTKIFHGHETEMVAWVDEMAQFIKATDSHKRPISISAYYESQSHAAANAIYALASIDHADFHFYPKGTYDPNAGQITSLAGYIRELQQTYKKSVFIGEFYPFTAQSGPINATGLFIESSLNQTPPLEYYPYRPSLAIIWSSFIATGGTGTAHRWNLQGLDQAGDVPLWQKMDRTYPILYGPLNRFINQVNWKSWNYGTIQAWENKTTSVNTDFVVGMGDGDQVMLMLHGTVDSVNLQIGSLEAGKYNIKLFDYISGNSVWNTTKDTVNQSLSLTVNLANSQLDSGHDDFDRKRTGIILTEKQSTAPPCSLKSQGDANCDGMINGVDYSIWLNSQCRPTTSQSCSDTRGDFNSDGNVDDGDYTIWFENRG